MPVPRSKQLLLLGDTRGAIVAEGVIVLPFFIIIFAAMILYHRSYAAKIERNVKARSCAWSYSVAGCRGPKPDGCPLTPVHEFASIGSAVDASELDESSKGVFTGFEKEGDKIDTAVNVTDRVALTLLGLREGIVAHPSRNIPVPSYLGGGQRAIRGDYTVMCNERKFSSFELAKEAYCAIGTNLAGVDFPGCGDKS